MLVHKDYYRCYYNNDPNHLIKTNLFDRWNVHFDLSNIEKRPLMSFKNELLNSCELMYDALKQYTPKLNVFLSGGTDSECLVRCFHERKIPITPVVIVHEHFPNSDETVIALNLCEELNLTPNIFRLDLVKLYETGIFNDMALKYQSQYLAMFELIYVMEQLQEPTILGDEIKLNYVTAPGNLLHKNETDYQQWFFYIEEDLDGVMNRYQYLSGIPMIADSFRYTPQSWAAMILTKNMKDIVFNNRFKATGMSTKNIMMSKEFGVRYRQKTNVFQDGIYRKIRGQLFREVLPKMFPLKTLEIEYTKLLNILEVEYEI